MNWWHALQVGLLRCASIRSRVVRTTPPLVPAVASRTGTLGGGGGGGVPRSTSITHFPRSTGDVRLAREVSVSTLPWPSRPSRVGSVTCRRSKATPPRAGLPQYLVRQPAV